ncbi:TrmH family RNA methyltransferase [Actinosynnema pretiosum subsp. pretiosum]|uniref:tRNA/rRNA methyltransferase (SpoU) n=2 Tax=Actinosynnema TaxID=40566 RepID=C6WR35_ACTMD|nr:TrmH family RNA methyltransferase [Actinosynnema mirum]ACU40728.1 tRNA/rRNA methyltransferase (SpoU) [Actinosynnema mirum DSM 43827]AXX34232.1 tRNA methyltransferase [Actinosynnema pretiosum subsp. pretiosum]QUF02049.1 TrmH family RNA methyltransferase [Actinosynnema pretiosum subsp. pretiosum]
MAGEVLLEGFHAVKHALRFGGAGAVREVLLTDRDAVLALARSHAPDLVDVFAAVEPVTAAELVRRTGRAHPTGVAGFAARPAAAVPGPDRTAPLVLLDNPRNLGNFGAVVRVAAGLGASGVVSTGDVDPWHPTVLRGSAGLHYALPVARVDDPAALEGELFAFDADGEPVDRVRFPDGAVLAFGSERHGLSERTRARADRVVSLPMRPLVSSYNLTTSVAMALYHWDLLRRAEDR